MTKSLADMWILFRFYEDFSGFLLNLYRFVWVLTSTSFDQPHDICFGLSPFLVRILSDDSRILENQLVYNPDINSVRNL